MAAVRSRRANADEDVGIPGVALGRSASQQLSDLRRELAEYRARADFVQ